MKTIAITVRHSLSGELKGEFLQIITLLESWGKTILLTPNAKKLIKNEEKYSHIQTISSENITTIDLFIFFGGDGTLLRTIHLFAPEIFSIPIFGINAGNIGFFSSTIPANKEKALKRIFEKNIQEDSRMIAQADIFDENDVFIKRVYALNEITIHHSGIARLRKITVSVSQDFLTTYRADGLIIATPTGSTAYNLAAGGPIISPQIPAFIITPLAPSGFSQRPIVLSSHKTLSFSPDAEMSVSIDGQEFLSLGKNHTIKISEYQNPLTFYRLSEENYYKNLREKLGWGK